MTRLCHGNHVHRQGCCQCQYVHWYFVLCSAHTFKDNAKSCHKVSYCETLNNCDVKLLQFYLQKCKVENAAMPNKLCEENGISFVEMDGFHNLSAFWPTSLTLVTFWKTTPHRCQREKLTIREGKKKLTVVIGQLTFLLVGGGQTRLDSLRSWLFLVF